MWLSDLPKVRVKKDGNKTYDSIFDHLEEQMERGFIGWIGVKTKETKDLSLVLMLLRELMDSGNIDWDQVILDPQELRRRPLGTHKFFVFIDNPGFGDYYSSRSYEGNIIALKSFVNRGGSVFVISDTDKGIPRDLRKSVDFMAEQMDEYESKSFQVYNTGRNKVRGINGVKTEMFPFRYFSHKERKPIPVLLVDTEISDKDFMIFESVSKIKEKVMKNVIEKTYKNISKSDLREE